MGDKGLKVEITGGGNCGQCGGHLFEKEKAPATSGWINCPYCSTSYYVTVPETKTDKPLEKKRLVDKVGDKDLSVLVNEAYQEEYTDNISPPYEGYLEGDGTFHLKLDRMYHRIEAQAQTDLIEDILLFYGQKFNASGEAVKRVVLHLPIKAFGGDLKGADSLGNLVEVLEPSIADWRSDWGRQAKKIEGKYQMWAAAIIGGIYLAVYPVVWLSNMSADMKGNISLTYFLLGTTIASVIWAAMFSYTPFASSRCAEMRDANVQFSPYVV